MLERPRIIIVDDNEAIHADFRKILDRSSSAATIATLDDLERAFGGEPVAAANHAIYDLAFASQGEDAISAVAKANSEGHPFGVAFVDIRMPPGIDGIETIERLWRCQSNLEVVLCSAYSDYSWDDISLRLEPADRLVVLRKPFDPIEVRQLAACLSEKWKRGRILDERLRNLEAQVRAEVEIRIRERARHEEEQRRGRRLEALGQLAAGLAHEINTPAQFANSNLDYLAEVLPSIGDALAEQRRYLAEVASGELSIAEACARADRIAVADLLVDAPKAIADAQTGIARISRIVSSVRSHAHLQDRDCLVSVDVNEQVRSALELARNEYRHDADAIVDLGAVPAVWGDPGDLCLAILNLIINAAHAIRDKRSIDGSRGTLTITTRGDARLAEVKIADTGCGIPTAIRERVFEPFFTTKPVGKGTGQGLSIARATIVERHRGSLWFESQTGGGTVFVISLPAATEAGAR